MTSNTPVPGVEDLYPHVSVLVGGALDGEVVMSPRVMALFMAPSVEEFTAFWEEHGRDVVEGIKAGRNEFPADWQRGARRRSAELRARYDCADWVGVLRGLHREYGVLPTGSL
ncbi:hypothetical protein GCM10022221_18130 [Actinocorallia aurea]